MNVENTFIPATPFDGIMSTNIWAWRFPYPGEGAQKVLRGKSRLGQAEEPVFLSKKDRDALIDTLGKAIDRAKSLDDFIAANATKDPQLKTTLGRDQSRFWALSHSLAPLFPTVETLLMQISEPEPDLWFAPSAQEAQDIRTWVVGINEMFAIIERHRPAPAPPPPPEILGIPKDQFYAGGVVAIGVGLLVYAVA
jgi:hypothetical protein